HIGRHIAVAGGEFALVHGHPKHQVHGGRQDDDKKCGVQHAEVAPEFPAHKPQQYCCLSFALTLDGDTHGVTSLAAASSSASWVREKKASSMPGWTILRCRISPADRSCSAIRSVSGVVIRMRCRWGS